MGQLAEEHGRQLGPAGEALGVALALMLFNQASEIVPGNLLEKLTEEAGRTYHGIALRGLVVNRIFSLTQFSHNHGGPRQYYICLGQE